jgi:TPR repeat protein
MQAAEQNEPNAIFAVGVCYHQGQGTEIDLYAAAEWYKKALDLGCKPDEEDRKNLTDLFGEANPLLK